MRGNVHLVQAIVLPSVCCTCSTIIVFGIHSMGKHFNHIIRWRFQSSLLPCRCSANARDVLSFLKLFNILFSVQTKCSYFFLGLGCFQLNLVKRLKFGLGQFYPVFTWLLCDPRISVYGSPRCFAADELTTWKSKQRQLVR